MKTSISISIDTDGIRYSTDEYLAALWHASQANSVNAKDSHQIARMIGCEIIRRFLAITPPMLYEHGFDVAEISTAGTA